MALSTSADDIHTELQTHLINRMTRGPDVIIAGAAKCATTWLFECFRDHPDVFAPSEEEISFFGRHDDRGFDWYLSHFDKAHSSQTIVEKSAIYLPHPEAAEQIYEWNPDVELLFVFRDPVARAYSHYCMFLRAEQTSENVEEEIQPGTRFIEDGRYATHLSRFREYFDDDQLHLFLMDDLKEDSREFLADTYRAAGLDPSYMPDLADEKFHHRKPRPRSAKLLTFLADIAGYLTRQSHWFHLLFRWLRRSRLVELFHRLNEGKDFPEMSPAFERELAEFFRPEIEDVSEYVERDLVEAWLEPYTRSSS